MSNRLLTPSELGERKERAWRAWSRWQVCFVRAHFPDTGGSLHLMHNWYRCAERTNPETARLANWVHDSVWERIHRITQKLDARIARNEHLLRHGEHFKPLWCPLCHSKERSNGS